MIVEQRTYTAIPGKWRDYLALYQAEGLQIQQRILGRMVGYYTTETGPLNQIIHMWAYTDLNERAERRAQLAADPQWQAYSLEANLTIGLFYFICCWLISERARRLGHGAVKAH